LRIPGSHAHGTHSDGHPDRAWYVWSPSPDRYRDVRVIFREEEPGNWSWDEIAGAWYWHRFYREQPDLNWTHPPVWQAMIEVVDHWLALGVDGFRLDALPYPHEAESTPCEGLPETHATLQALAAHVRARRPDAILLGEANGTTEGIRAYFGDGRGCSHMLDFRRMTATWLAVAREEAAPLAKILATDEVLPEGCQWATFLRNHDELTTEHLDEADKDAILARFAPCGSQRRFGGVRRRLASLAADARLWRLLHGTWLLGPGCPVIWYGDEIAMAEVPGQSDRMGLSTPMLWEEGPSTGFSRMPPEDLPISLGSARGGPVSRQSETTRSAFGHIRQLLAIRRAYPQVGAPKRQVISEGPLLVLHPGKSVAGLQIAG
jgi:maltose alpha-D-glucosyltransferase/alpha-amylase